MYYRCLRRLKLHDGTPRGDGRPRSGIEEEEPITEGGQRIFRSPRRREERGPHHGRVHLQR